MADAAYDAVIIGGGTKALATAIYLAKYGGMSVGIFERRHELVGGLASSEAAAPGFVGDSHATNMQPWYYLPVKQDFPDFEEKGGKQAHFKVAHGVITRENQECCTVYHRYEDPAQERTAREIARFAGNKDAETYLKLHKSAPSFYEAFLQTWFNLPPAPGEQSALDRWFADYLKQPDCPVDEEWLTLSPYKAALHLFNSPGLVFMWLRIGLAAGLQPVESGQAWMLLSLIIGSTPGRVFTVGGTHSIAHAYIKIFLEHGGKFFTHSHVDKIIIQNGTARGIRLSDGTEVEARQLVLSGVDLRQLCFQFIGREHLSQRIIKKVEYLEGGWNCSTWYTWALREPINFKAADFNPDINQAQNIVLASRDLEVLIREAYLRRLGKNPPIENRIYHHEYNVDKSRAPEGRATILTEQFVAPANCLREKEWLQFKRAHAKDVVHEYQDYATNMNWDNIIGYDPLTPYDTAGRLINMAPWGDWGIVNMDYRRPANMRPISEFARHRIPNIKNLYATGAVWQPSGSCDAGYLAYKAIAQDLELRKPWEEKGRPY